MKKRLGAQLGLGSRRENVRLPPPEGSAERDSISFLKPLEIEVRLGLDGLNRGEIDEGARDPFLGAIQRSAVVNLDESVVP
jgi:hypothetical protein